jgi:hypothetical protein
MAIVILSEPFFKDCGTRRRKFIKCRCDCGKEFETRVGQKAESCGCSGRFQEKHGGSRGKTYKVWTGMRQRCNNPRSAKFDIYGGRGIKVCQRWEQSFQNFIDDMGERPDGKTLDRINPDGNYEPGNCRWADIEEQNNNRRSNNYVTIYGKTMTLSQWCRVNPETKMKTARERLERGWTPKEAIYGKPR